MRLEIDIPEHHYNNIMSIDSVSLGRAPYKGIVMYAINAIKHGKVLEQEPNCSEIPTSSNDLPSELEKNSKKLEKDFGESDCISRAEALDCLKATELKKFDWIIDAREKISNLPLITPQPRKGHWILRPHIYGVAFCSECGFELIINNTNYCPNCGVKMIESEV